MHTHCQFGRQLFNIFKKIKTAYKDFEQEVSPRLNSK